MTDTIDANVAPDATRTQQIAPSELESKLIKDAAAIWAKYRDAQSATKLGRVALKEAQTKLGETLSQLKSELSRVGRHGQWSAFLRKERLPRTTADRLIRNHTKSSQPAANCTNGAISDPSDEKVDEYVRKRIDKFNAFVDTPRSAFRFVEGVAIGLNHLKFDYTTQGLLLLFAAAPNSTDAGSDPASPVL